MLAGTEIAGDVVHRVVEKVLTRTEKRTLEEIIHETIFAEQTRLAHLKGASDVPDRQFVTWLRHELAHAGESKRPELVRTIVERYAREISGHFDPRVYRLATGVVRKALGALFHSMLPGLILSRRELFDVHDRVLIEGEVGQLRSLERLGTIILAPTHVSNLDSVILGHAIDRMSLPPFAYGAGLNLFQSQLMGFFMRNLGAYTVDRKKTDPLYRATLKEYATVLLERGQHNLFFPGGTRARSGAVETHLKKGLLGTSIRAYRGALATGAPHPRIFIVPCTLTYPLVLEASSLIEQYLRAEGGAHYVELRDEFDQPTKWIEFTRHLLKLDLRIHLRIGRALDPMGNEVDEEGRSLGPRGGEVDPARYLLAGGRLVEDAARDAEHTRMLASRLVTTYRRDTVALPTSALAFVVFDRLRREAGEPDLFRFLRGMDGDTHVPVDVVRSDLERLFVELRDLERAKKLRTESGLTEKEPLEVMNEALETFGTNRASPVLVRTGGHVHVRDPNLLFFYRNRLDGYGLFGAPSALLKDKLSAPKRTT